MLVILLQDIRGVGHKHEVKDISDGYARNFLLPRKLAEPATEANMKKLKELQAAEEKKNNETVKRLREIARQINDSYLEFPVKADKDGHIFGSVNKDSILKAMREHGWVTKERVEVLLEHPLKKLGEHKIKIDLKKGVTTELKVILTPES